MRSLTMVGVVRVEAGGSSSWCRIVPQPAVFLLRLIWIQLGVDGRNVAETDVVACSDTGEHAGHVVEENLDRALGGSLVLALP